MAKHIPFTSIKIRQRDKPWITPHIRKLFKSCYKLHKRKNNTNRPDHILAYLNKRRETKEAFRQAKKDYYTNISDKILNPQTTSKTFWSLLKSLFNTNNTGIPTLNVNGTHIENNRQKAEALNNFFASQTTLPNTDKDLPPFHYKTDARLDRLNITPAQVKQILLDLDPSKSVGPDSISNKLLKACADTLCYPLSYIFQKSLDQGIFPDSWKEALITAIFKKLDPSLTSNYRPISLLNCISKVFEKAVFMHVYPYLKTNNLFTDKNSGFHKNDGATNRLLAMANSIYKGFDNKKDSILVSLDVSKAFDRVWHRGLLFKLKQYGITGNLLLWFKSYLTNRIQRVSVGGSFSTYKQIQAGVPQGSILGPMLFLIYVNDMCDGLTSQAHQFADDTTLIYTFSDPTEATNVINSDLDKLEQWAEQWLVTFNPIKTHFLLMSLKKKNKPKINNIKFKNTPIMESDSITTLGITITNVLSWDPHVKNIIAKASKRLLILKYYKNTLPRIALERLYTTMIRPILEYGDIVFSNLSQSTARSIEKVQRQAAIACTGAYKHTSYNSLLKELNWESLEERRYLNKLTTYYKIVKNIYPRYLNSLLPTNQPSNYNLRRPQPLRPRFSRLSASTHSFFPSTTRDWNALPEQTRQAPSVNCFKALVRGTNNFNPYHRLCNGKPLIWLSRLRMGLSALNSHRHNYNFIPTPTCIHCNEEETTDHFLLQCVQYAAARAHLLHQLETMLEIDTTDPVNLLNTILEGANMQPRHHQDLLSHISAFLRDTGRFR